MLPIYKSCFCLFKDGSDSVVTIVVSLLLFLVAKLLITGTVDEVSSGWNALDVPIKYKN